MERVFYIDLYKITTKEELQDLLAKELPLPEHYGKNLDALYDVFTEQAKEWNIIFYNSKSAELNLGKYFDTLKKMCLRACKEAQGLRIRFFD